MRSADSVTLFISGSVFLVFIANVIVGAAGGSGYLSDVAEMLTLLVACILFVIAVLVRERSRDLAAGKMNQRD